MTELTVTKQPHEFEHFIILHVATPRVLLLSITMIYDMGSLMATQNKLLAEVHYRLSVRKQGKKDVDSM